MSLTVVLINEYFDVVCASRMRHIAGHVKLRAGSENSHVLEGLFLRLNY